MSISLRNPTDVVTEQRLKDFYDGIYPYLGSTANAGFTPVGTIIAVMGVTAPANYLACNGQVVNIADYKELATYFESQFGSKNYFGGDGTTTFGIPDLRGEFLRGTGTNSHNGQGSGADVGTHQDGTLTPMHWIANETGVLTYRINSNSGASIENYDNLKRDESPTVISYNKDTSSSSGNASIGITSRPTNTSVLYCIATKNIYLNPNLQYNYSTDEQIIGIWVDGKTLYQKTEHIIVSTNSTANFDFRTVIQNMCDLIEYKVVCGYDGYNSGGYRFLKNPDLTSTNNNTANTCSYTDGGLGGTELKPKILTLKNTHTSNEGHFYITCQYTKTTD